MRTARLPTAYAFVAATRCQCWCCGRCGVQITNLKLYEEPHSSCSYGRAGEYHLLDKGTFTHRVTDPWPIEKGLKAFK